MAVQEELARAHSERAAAEGALKVLQESPEMRGIEALQRTREETEQREGALRQVEADLANADERALNAAGDEKRLSVEAESAGAAAQTAGAAADHAALQAALAEAHREAVGGDAPGPPTLAATATLRAALDTVVHQRREALSHLRELQQRVTTAVNAYHNALQRLHERESALRDAESAEADARVALAHAARALLDDYRAWAEVCRELVATPTADLGELFFEWIERRDGTSPLEQALNEARAAVAQTFATAQVHLASRRAQHDAEAQAVVDEITRLEGGTHAPPTAPPLRAADRTGRPGAPLWRVCDFQPELADADRAGLEAALEASGLLDAWLLPDGTLLDLATDDTFLLARPAEASGFTLARWLVPGVDSNSLDVAAVTADTVAQVLAGIGAGVDVGEHWVSLDGGWRLGPLTGHARKLRAEHIGETAREAARQRRLAELRERADQLAALGAVIDAEVANLAARRAAADAEARAFPDHEPLRTAGAALGHSLTAVAQAADAVEKARIAEDEMRRAHDAARQRRDTDAGDLGLLKWVDDLDVLGESTHAYDLALARLWPALESWARSAAEAARSRELAVQERQRRDEWQIRMRGARKLYDEARGRLAELLATVGADEQQLLEREAEQRREVQRLGEAAKRGDDELHQIETRLVLATADIGRYTQERGERDARRQEGFARLRHLVEAGLVAEAEPALADDDFSEWSATRLVELARRLEEQLQTRHAMTAHERTRSRRFIIASTPSTTRWYHTASDPIPAPWTRGSWSFAAPSRGACVDPVNMPAPSPRTSRIANACSTSANAK
jgi:hypothetical protein